MHNPQDTIPIAVTFEDVTPESASIGEIEANGFVTELERVTLDALREAIEVGEYWGAESSDWPLPEDTNACRSVWLTTEGSVVDFNCYRTRQHSLHLHRSATDTEAEHWRDALHSRLVFDHD